MSQHHTEHSTAFQITVVETSTHKTHAPWQGLCGSVAALCGCGTPAPQHLLLSTCRLNASGLAAFRVEERREKRDERRVVIRTLRYAS